MTDPAIIAASYTAERNYSHNPDDVIDSSGAVGAWGTAKESTTELVDLSGNGNIATIHGPMPTEGFMQGRRFDAVDDYIVIPASIAMDTPNNYTIEILYQPTDITSMTLLNKYGRSTSYGYWWLYRAGTDKAGLNWQYTEGNNKLTVGWANILNLYKYTHILLKYDADANTIELIADGISKGVLSTPNALSPKSNVPIYFGTLQATSDYLGGILLPIMISNTLNNGNFNTLARLPFWSVNYTDYPNNVTEYTDNLPYSSSIINSGTFKVDDDKLQCVSAGTITYSASYDFDGSEFVKVTIDGVEYAGTGTITQGNTTVSVAQGSNKITITMGTGDTIEGEIGIQFREEV